MTKNHSFYNVMAAWDYLVAMGYDNLDYNPFKSSLAGYLIYTPANGEHFPYVCDLGDRLELNTEDGNSVNLWYGVKSRADLEEESEEIPEIVIPAETNPSHVSVECISKETGEVRFFETFSAFADIYSFFNISIATKGFIEKCGVMARKLEKLADPAFSAKTQNAIMEVTLQYVL